MFVSTAAITCSSTPRNANDLLVDLAQHLLHGALFEFEDVLEHEQHAAHFLALLLVVLARLSSTLRSRLRSAWLRMPAMRPATGGGVLLLGCSMARIADSTC